ncbi:MAG: anaerobic glycerol-3-phosphate dehydrogenase subunit C [Propionibacteriaceae bacterium]|jgi:glycerol-3-phosphate dehydrogenase subunit C|nr:anaerobic glycerol-3-phosphate dehydrogenase subunit C [Propionibacteriaceae bacterium]
MTATVETAPQTALDFAGHELARHSLDACVKCTICETQCPVLAVTPLFSGPKYVGPQAERFRKGLSVDHTLDYCSSCGTCTLVCPQGVKIAELNSQARAVMKKDHMPVRDKLISQTIVMGKLMTPVAPVANAALAFKPLRSIVQGVIGIHKDAPLPRAHFRTFMGWWKNHKKPAQSPRGKVVFFHGCAGGYFEVQTSIMTVEVLEHLGYEVVVPKQGCCGLAQQSNGLFNEASESVLKLADALRTGPRDVPIISASGSCTGMLKHEAREIMGVKDARLQDVGTRIRDIMEFLLDLHEAGELDEDFKRIDMTVGYHAPCQLKGQGMGMPAVDVLSLIPGLNVVESGKACCGIAGTYGLKKEKYEVAQAVGKPLFEKLNHVNPRLSLVDTETCRWQIRKGTGAQVEHPIYMVHKAYGL